MSGPSTDEPGGDGTTAVSGFGGHVLSMEAVGAVDSSTATATLEQLGVTDAEQLVAISAIPGLASHLQDALGLGDPAYRGLLDAALDVLPPDRSALVSQPTSVTDLGLGVREPTAEMVAAAQATSYATADDSVPAAQLPAAVSLTSLMPPIRSQAGRGTCVGFTLTALNEYVLRRRAVVRDLSEQDLYYKAKLIDGSPDGCGTWQAKAVLALRDRGQCRESIWPYNPNPPCNNHGARPAQAGPDGLANRLTTYAVATRNVAAYKAELARQRPVTLSIPVYDSWHRSAETRRSGRITMRIGQEQQAGGHAVCLVGYQDAAGSPGGGYFIVRNSWNTTWAYQSPYGGGYGTIPYQYIADDAWEAFSAALPVMGDETDGGVDGAARSGTSVVIQVGSDVTITIESR
jgi:hypothetical protein